MITPFHSSVIKLKTDEKGQRSFHLYFGLKEAKKKKHLYTIYHITFKSLWSDSFSTVHKSSISLQKSTLNYSVNGRIESSTGYFLL